MEERRIIQVEEKLPIAETIPLSLQHLFAMFGSTVLVPFLLKVDPSTALFMNGVGTLLYLTICKWRLPAYLGSSFAFISPVLAVCATPGMSYGDAQGGFIAFGLCFILIGLMVRKIGTKWIDVLFPPAAMGSIVAIIGLELAPLALNMSGFMDPVKGMTNAQAMTISMVTLIVTILANVVGKGFIAIIPILIGVVSGYVLSYFMGVVDFFPVASAAWFSFPTFYKPEFNLSAIMMILPALFVVLAEHLGHLFVTSDIVGRDPRHPHPCDGRCLHFIVRVYCCFRAAHDGGTESGLHPAQEPDPYGCDHDQRPFRCCGPPGSRPAQRHGPGHRGGHHRQPGLPDFRKIGADKRKIIGFPIERNRKLWYIV